MPRGDKGAYTDKQRRKAQHIEQSYEERGVPKETADEMIRVPDTKHIAVYCKGCWYKLNVFHEEQLLRPAELEKYKNG